MKLPHQGLKIFSVTFKNTNQRLNNFLYARPLVAEDFENLTDESIVYASGDSTSYTLTEENVQNTESYYAGVLADLDPPRIGPPGPNPLADMDPPVHIR